MPASVSPDADAARADGAPHRPADPAAGVKVAQRTANVAHASGLSMLALGGLSAVANVLHPVSAGFFISVAVVLNGVVEWRGAKRLARGDAGALGRLAANQAALGLEILAYGAWQATHVSPESVLLVLQRPYLRPVLEAFPRENVELLFELLPQLVRPIYGIVGAGGAFGAWAVALFYLHRRRQLRSACD